jgi:uncharacterized protein (TIGR02270 family)
MSVAFQRAFLGRLYDEYLEEGSFLYEQRRTLLNNPELSWKKIGEFEERLEAHIDGLVVGDQLALDVCKRHAIEGEFGELFAIICVFCRQNRQDLVLAIFEKLDPGDAAKTFAVADALKYELPAAWFPDFLMLLASGDPKLAPILARAFGYRRLPCGPQLLAAMKRCATPALPEIVWALGRISHAPAKDLLLDYLRSEDEPVRSAAAVALARMGEARAIDYCLDQAPSNTWPILPLGLAGGHRALAVLIELANRSGANDCLVALGSLGDPGSVPLLISRLEQPDAAPPAAIALQAITGASLFETVFIPDEVDEDELFESEREQWRQGKPLDRGDGRPFGSTVTRLSQKPEDWSRWWQANGSRFTPGWRYRNGGPYSPARLIETLEAENTPHQLRWCCSEELVTRYGKDFGIEMDMPQTRQTILLAEAAAWSASSEAHYREGAWYFAGQQHD